MTDNVKVTLKPTEQILAAASTVETVTAGDKVFTLKKPGILAQYRIVEVVGDSAKNEVYMGMVMPLLWITAINGEPEPAISTKRELEGLIQRVGEEGVGSIMTHISQIGTDPVSKEAVKN